MTFFVCDNSITGCSMCRNRVGKLHGATGSSFASTPAWKRHSVRLAAIAAGLWAPGTEAFHATMTLERAENRLVRERKLKKKMEKSTEDSHWNTHVLAFLEKKTGWRWQSGTNGLSIEVKDIIAREFVDVSNNRVVVSFSAREVIQNMWFCAPQKFLGAGGFGFVFECQDGNVVKIPKDCNDSMGARSENEFHERLSKAHGTGEKFVPGYLGVEWHLYEVKRNGLHGKVQCPIIKMEKGTAVKKKNLSIDDLIRLNGDISAAIRFFGRQNLAHRDIKLDNILKINDRYVLADFGMVAPPATPLENVGTPAHKAPEIYARQSSLTDAGDAYEAVDVFALGVTLALSVDQKVDASFKEAVVNFQKATDWISVSKFKFIWSENNLPRFSSDVARYTACPNNFLSCGAKKCTLEQRTKRELGERIIEMLAVEPSSRLLSWKTQEGARVHPQTKK